MLKYAAIVLSAPSSPSSYPCALSSSVDWCRDGLKENSDLLMEDIFQMCDL